MLILRLLSLVFFFFLTACSQSLPIPRANPITTQTASTRALDEEQNYLSFVEGYVIDRETQTPIANAIVSIPGLETTTNNNGYYLLRGVPTGRQALEIKKTGYEPLYRIAEVPNSSDGQTLTMKLAELEPKSTRVTMIGSSGGTHYASADGEAGPFLKIPTGALEKETPIQFTHLRTANTLPELPQDGYYLAFAHLGPTGLVFKKPATLFLPLQAGVEMPIGTPINISYFDAREAKWVDDITNGKISRVNGKLFLEYEINHFTWIGGQAPSDSVSFNIQDQNGNPLPGITTNYGVSNNAGTVFGTMPRFSSEPPTIRPTVPTNMNCTTPNSPTRVSGTPVNFLNPVNCNITAPLVDQAQPLEKDCPPPGIHPKSAGIKTQSLEVSKTIFSEKNFIGFTINLRDFKRSGGQAQNIKVMLGNTDYTRKTRLKTKDNDNLEVSVKFTEPFQAQTNLKFSVEVTGFNQNFAKTELITDVIPRLKTPENIIPMIVPDDIPLTKTTPYTIEGPKGLLVVARESDIQNGFINTQIPIKALDTKGQILSNLNSEYEISLGAGINNGSAKFEAGIAIVPIKLAVNNGGSTKTFGRMFVMPSSTNAGSRVDSSGVRPQQAVLDGDCDPPVAGAKPVALDAKTTVFDTVANAPVIGNLLDWINGWQGNQACIQNFCVSVGQAIGLVWSIIPGVGDGTTLLDNFVKSLSGQGADPIEVFLAGVGLALDFTPAGQLLGALPGVLIQVYRIAKGAGTDFLARAIRESVEVCRRLRLNPVECAQRLENEIGEIARIFTEGGSAAIRSTEEFAAGLRSLPCPNAGIGVRPQASGVPLLCDEANIRIIVKQISQNSEADGVTRQEIFVALRDICCDGNYIQGAENLVAKTSTSAKPSNVVGNLREARAAKVLRDNGFQDMLIPRQNTLGAQVDLIARDPSGNLRFIETKSLA